MNVDEDELDEERVKNKAVDEEGTTYDGVEQVLRDHFCGVGGSGSSSSSSSSRGARHIRAFLCGEKMTPPSCLASVYERAGGRRGGRAERDHAGDDHVSSKSLLAGNFHSVALLTRNHKSLKLCTCGGHVQVSPEARSA